MLPLSSRPPSPRRRFPFPTLPGGEFVGQAERGVGFRDRSGFQGAVGVVGVDDGAGHDALEGGLCYRRVSLS